MQQIATSKSVLYGIIMTVILMVSSCEFNITTSDVTATSSPTIASNDN
ncbi:MAG: hypothetical protein OEY29_01670 [Gammaproteobacteria bacterium]|nr:hypothetical protein [Gammaproteobacteria bacterium]